MLKGSIEGASQLSQNLLKLANMGTPQAGRRAMSAALQFLAKQARGQAPRGKTGRLAKSVRYRVTTKNRAVVRGRVTLAAKHGHLVTLGTERRFRKTIGGRFQILRPAAQDFRNKATGQVRPNPFFRRAMKGSANNAVYVMAHRLKQELQREIRRAKG